ncbi:MAG: class I SAM-dependent methyltransferase [Verrucomicrobiia bacterium]
MTLVRKIRRILGIIYRNLKFTLSEEVKRKILPPKLPRNINGKVYIHLGCGAINAKGFINVDILPYSHVHYIQQVEDLSIFPDEYADLIYASHVLEHISHNDVSKVLKEWHRVLKKEGILRISVPDFDKLINVYFSEDKDIKSIIGPLMGGQDNPYNFHKSVFNEKYLKELLLAVGFKEMRQWESEKVEMHEFQDWASLPIRPNNKEYFISLNIEAIK